MSVSISPASFGWLRELPSLQDYTMEHPAIIPMLESVSGVTNPPVSLPTSVDLRAWCSPIENQLNLGSCTANAGVGIVEYYERRAFGKDIDASRLFLYKATRDLMKQTGDTGAFLRTTMEALVLFGVPPETYCPYIVANFDNEPSAFLYAFAENYQALNYYRLDPIGTTSSALLATIKTNLAAGLPSMFGFTVYSSYTQASVANQGAIPYPVVGEKIVGGHAIMAVGYNDSVVIKNANSGATATTGAFLIRNSWGTAWGNAGYGWLPYNYVLKGLATDWWSLLSQKWVDTDKFN